VLPGLRLLRILCNMPKLGNGLLDAALRELRGRLPARWKVEMARAGKSPAARLRVTGPDRKTALVAVETRRRLDPRTARELASRLEPGPEAAPVLVVAPYLSPTTRECFREADIGFLDLTGNIYLELVRPGLFIEARGADVDPDRRKRPSRSLRGTKASRVVRGLVEARAPIGVRELAERTGVDPGYTSRLLALLDRETLVERNERRGIASVDWPKLLRRSAEDAPLDSRGATSTTLDPRGLPSLQARLRESDATYAITGSLAAAAFAPIAAPRLAIVYVGDLKTATTELGLRSVDAGANVWLIEPNDAGVFAGAVEKDGLRYVALSQVVADLLGSPGRGPSEAEELIAWMQANEDAWRG